MLGWRLFAVRGPSMVPTLRPGDRVLVWARARPRPGQVVVGRFRDLPGVLVVKRVAARDADGWLLASDNPFAEGDGSRHGTADVEGVVVLVATRRGGLRRPRARA